MILLGGLLIGCEPDAVTTEPLTQWERDDDGDGYSDWDGDCDDADPNVGPRAPEVPGNGLDEDCDCLDVATVLVGDESLLWRGDAAGDRVGALGLTPVYVDGRYAGALFGAHQPHQGVTDDPGHGRAFFVTRDGNHTELSGFTDYRWGTMGMGSATGAGPLGPDGETLLLVGRPGASEPPPGDTGVYFDGGTIEVYEPTTQDPSTGLEESWATLYSGVVHAGCGYGIALDDWTGDGVIDLAVSCPGSSAEGYVYILEGPIQAGDSSSSTAHARYWEGSLEPEQGWDEALLYGEGLSAPGDITGDGQPDLLIALRGDRERGDLVVIAGPVEPGDRDLPDEDFRIQGPDEGYPEITSSVADVTGDGQSDLILSNLLVDRRGALWLLPGPITHPASLATLTPFLLGSCPTEWFAYSHGQGDFNGDGILDLVVGAPQDYYYSAPEPGHVYLFFGPDWNGGADDPASADVILRGNAAFDGFGDNLAVADTDGDGFDDLLVSAPWDSQLTDEGGRIYLIRGGPEGLGVTTAAE